MIIREMKKKIKIHTVGEYFECALVVVHSQ